MKLMPIKSFYFFLIILLSFYIKNVCAELLSHKASYSLNVQNIKDGSFLEGGQGQSYFEISKTCEGWNVKEDYVLIYEFPNKKMSNSFSTYSTFENFSSTKHSFELNDKSELSGENAYQGYLEKKKNNISGTLIKENIKNLSFNKDVLFPIEHLKKIIEKAEAGEKLYTTKVFFGNEEKDFIKTVSTFIGNRAKARPLGFDYIADNEVWKLKISFYTNNSKKGNPDYEIKLELDQNGVAHYYEVDYGDFEIKANLKSFEVIDEKKCN